MPQKELSCLLAIISITLSFSASAGQWSGYLGAEFRYFPQDARDSRQHDENLSLLFEPEFYHEWDKGTQSLAFVPFFRLDQNDSERSHIDIRELTWLKAAESWEIRIGFRKVFWGVTEFQHLVDIINQTDLVENIDTEDKLGQPMINLALINDWGTVDLFVLPYFRERTFPGTEGRLRTQLVVDEGLSKFESSAKEKHVDLAIRYSHYFGDWDIGLSHFYGTSRDPRLIPTINTSGTIVLSPFYDIINQTSIDLQATKGNMLWKLEALHRSGQDKTYNAIAGGFEYTFVGIFDSAIDLGALGEYHYDNRGESAPTIFEDDIGTGMRLAFNDAQSSQVLMGLIWDRNTNGKFLNIEASRRIGNDWMLEIESRFLFDQSSLLKPFAFSRDDYLQMFLTYNF